MKKSEREITQTEFTHWTDTFIFCGKLTPIDSSIFVKLLFSSFVWAFLFHFEILPIQLQ